MSTTQQKNWHILPKISDTSPPAPLLNRRGEYSEVVLQLLYNRGFTEKNEIEQFLNPDYKKYAHDPFLFARMNEAVNLIIKHIKKQNKIVVYGDYDADGVTSSAVLFETFSTLKAKVDVYIPDRVSEGYGLNKKAIDKLKEAGAKLIITVDNGIRGKDEVKYAKSAGMEIVITDHHPAPEDADELPDCLIINPIVENEKYPFKYLAGVGVAFKLAKALISKSTLFEDDKKKLEQKILDLVAIGTVADCVSLLGENRVLVKKGLEVLNNTKRVGLKELINIAQISNKVLEAWNIGFQIAPRLNAAGRMDHANTAFELLATKNKSEAVSIARRLNDKNIERQKVTDEIIENAYEQIKDDVDNIIICVCPNELEKIWNEGVIGLVAGRICEKYYRPTLIITKTGETLKGSGRSIDEFNIIKAVEECGGYLEKFGGHAAACGFSLLGNNLDKFIEKIKRIADKKLKDIDLKPKIVIDTELDLSEVNEKFIKDLEKFAPFGENNPRPKFVSRGVQIKDIVSMGINGQHVKFKLATEEVELLRLQSNRSSSTSFWAVAFGQAEKWQELRIGDKIDIVYYAEMNEFNGKRKAQLKVVDIKCNANAVDTNYANNLI